MLFGLFKKKKVVVYDPVDELMQRSQYMTAKNARMFTKFREGNMFVPTFKNRSVDEVVNDVLSEVDRFTKQSQLQPVDSASIVYTADILRSLNADYRTRVLSPEETDKVVRHYADCRATVMCAIEVLEKLGYAVRVMSMAEGCRETSVLSVHW